MYNHNVSLKSEELLCGVKSVVSDVKLKHGRLLNPYRSFGIQKYQAFIEQLTVCQYSENDLGKCLLQETKFRSKLYIYSWKIKKNYSQHYINPLKPELNPICYLLALLGAHHFLHVSRIRVKLLTLR